MIPAKRLSSRRRRDKRKVLDKRCRSSFQSYQCVLYDLLLDWLVCYASRRSPTTIAWLLLNSAFSNWDQISLHWLDFGCLRVEERWTWICYGGSRASCLHMQSPISTSSSHWDCHLGFFAWRRRALPHWSSDRRRNRFHFRWRLMPTQLAWTFLYSSACVASP